MNSRWEEESGFRALFADVISGKVEYLSHMTGKSASWFYKVSEGLLPLIPDDIPVLWNILKDPRLILWFVKRCEGVTVSFKSDVVTNGDLTDEALDMTAKVGEFAAILKKALDDKHITKDEKAELADVLLDLKTIIDTAFAEMKELPATGVERTKTGFHVNSVSKG